MLEDYYNFLASHKGKDIAVFDVSDEDALGDYVIIQHFHSTADNKKFADEFMKEFSLTTFPEGYNRGEWIVFDLDDVIIHSFTCEKRAKYNLDKLWQNKKLIVDNKNSKKNKK